MLQKRRARHKRRRDAIVRDLRTNGLYRPKTFKDKKKELKRDRKQEQKEIREYELERQVVTDTRKNVPY